MPISSRVRATVAAEMIEQLPEGVVPDLVIMPVGGGGLSAGMTGYLKGTVAPGAFVFCGAGGGTEPAPQPGDRFCGDA